MARRPQLSLDLPTRSGWGGARPGSGRKPRGKEAGVSHERVLEPDARLPVHVTVRAREHVWNLRSRRGHAVIAAALRGRIAIGLNRMMGRRGPVFADRYHAHVLRTPSEVRNAVAYVLGNFASHARRRGEPLEPGWVDPYSSAAPHGPDGLPPPVSEPRSWLLRSRGPVAREPIAREPEAAYARAA